MERVINIVGMGASGKDVDDTGENWVINLSYKFMQGKKISKMFFMDDLVSELLPQDKIMEPLDYTFDKFLEDNPDVDLISKYNSVIKDDKGNSIKGINEYPLDKAVYLANGGYFTSTIAYVICYAILEKVDRIRLYGFEIWSGSDSNEYQYQRPCIDFWLAFALARGIKVEIPYFLLNTVQNNQNYYGFEVDSLTKNYRRT